MLLERITDKEVLRRINIKEMLFCIIKRITLIITAIHFTKETYRESCLMAKLKEEEKQGDPEQCGRIPSRDGQA